MYDDNEEDYRVVTFSMRSHINGVNSSIERRLTDKETYSELLEEFHWFLQSIGFTYIEGLTAFGSGGKEMFVTRNH